MGQGADRFLDVVCRRAGVHAHLSQHGGDDAALLGHEGLQEVLGGDLWIVGRSAAVCASAMALEP
jgi:hypothetical protein